MFISSAFIICYKVFLKSCCTVEFGEIRFTNCKEMWTQSASCVFPNISEDCSYNSTNQKTKVHITQPAKPTKQFSYIKIPCSMSRQGRSQIITSNHIKSCTCFIADERELDEY